MSVAKYQIGLEWKSFSICLESVEAWMKANAGPDYCGNQAHGKFELWFLEEPTQDIKDAIETYWDALADDSDEAVAYKSAADRAEEKATKKASGKAKLAALGLSADEIAALVG